MKTITIGIIGAGYIGKEHARSLRLVAPMFGDQVKIVAIADTNLETAKEAAKHFGIERATDDIDSVINDDSINTIFSCVPTKYHFEVIEKAVKKGKAVFCEKPFATSLEQAEQMHELLTNSKAPHQVGFVLRYAPTYHALKSILKEQDEKSKLRTVLLRDDQVFPIQGLSHFTDWRSKAELAGAGVLIEHGIHDIDLFEWLFGRVTRVSARQNNFHGFEGIEDYIEVRMEFESGVTANMVHLWHKIGAHQSIRSFEIFHNESLTTLETYDMHHITVLDNEAEHTLKRVDLFKRIKDLPVFKDLAEREDILFVSDYYAIQDYWFVRNLIEGNKPSPSIDDGLRAFKLAHACYDSAKNDGAWVNV